MNVALVLVISLHTLVACRIGGLHLVLHLVPSDMDEAFFSQLPPDVAAIDVKETYAARLVVTAENRLRGLSIMNGLSLHEFALQDNAFLNHLLLRSCQVDGWLGSFTNLHALSILKIERSRLNGTFNLAELLALPSLRVFSVENNQLTQVELLLDEPRVLHKQRMPPALEQLDLSGNLLEHFDLRVLSPFQQLRLLLLNRNLLKTLAGEVTLPELRTLMLVGNRFDGLDLSDCHCSALQVLYAANNNLSTIPTFDERSTRIQTLDLRFNALTVVHSSDLSHRSHLTHLILSNNAIGRLVHDLEANGSTVELPSLESLLLDNNQLDGLDLRGWSMPTLKLLRIHRNPLRSIAEDLIVRLPMLTTLDCYCSLISCAWFKRHERQIRTLSFGMDSVDGAGNGNDGRAQECEPIPTKGCVLCRRNATDSDGS